MMLLKRETHAFLNVPFSFFFIVILCIVEIKSLSDSLHLRPLIFSCEDFVIKFSYVHNGMDYSLPCLTIPTLGLFVPFLEAD